MNDALNTPVRRTRTTTSADFPIEQKDDILLRDGQDIPREQVIVSMDTPLEDNYADALKFAEEPVTILIYPSREKNAPVVVDCWVNGKGAEVFVGGKWHVFNCLPVNIAVTTKRKYVEVLARSKIDTINTLVDDATVENPMNRINRVTSSTAVFTVIGDSSPKGVEWLKRLMSQQG